MERYVLVTGGGGFVGCNLADALLADGERVTVVDSFVRPGSRRNAEWLGRRHGERVRIRQADVRDSAAMQALAGEAKAIYHLAAQVAVTHSLAEPREDLEVNLLGTFNILEAARAAPHEPPVLFTSTNKVYGSLPKVPVELMEGGYRFRERPRGIDESEPLDLHSPYGCSKGAADQYVRDYARIYGLPTVVLRMSCIYGERQMGTEDQGWVAHFARCVLAGTPITVYGDGHQVRDVLWVGDLVTAMRTAMSRASSHPGEVYNIGGGPANLLSVRDAARRIMEIAGRTVPVRTSDWRPGDQRVYVSDIARAATHLEWTPRVQVDEGLERLVAWLRKADAESLPPLPRRAPRRAGAWVAAGSAG